MGAELIINIGIIILFVLIFIFFYIKDGESQRRLAIYEKSLDDLNRELYRLNKMIKEVSSVDTSKNDFRNAVDDIYNVIEKDREYVDNKLQILEDKIKENSSYLQSTLSNVNVDDKRIISMFRSGLSVENIAKELMIAKSEVEFILKLADIK